MPPAFLAVLPVIISAATEAAAIGVELTNKPSQQTVTPTPTTTAQSPGTSAAQKAAVASSLPTLQSMTGGSISPEYAAQWGGQQTGVSSDPQGGKNIQDAINQFFGFGAPGTTGLSTTGTGGGTPGNSITDLLSKMSVPGAQSGGGGGIVDAALSSDTFHGFGG